MYVKVAKGLDNGRVAVWDSDPSHLLIEAWKYWNGAFIVADGSDTVYEVAETPTVLSAINHGNLVEVDEPVAPVVVEEKKSKTKE